MKVSTTVVIPKPNKPDYSAPKAYRPIVLLNCIGKIFEKMLSNQMQFDAQMYHIVDEQQFGGLYKNSTIDAGMRIADLTRQTWKKKQECAAMFIDVAQFYPSVNQETMTKILHKQGFPEEMCKFFENYMTGRKTTYVLGGTSTAPTSFDVGIGQGSALSPILSNLYIAPAIKAAVQKAKENMTGTNIQFYVDDGLLWATCTTQECAHYNLTPAELNSSKLTWLYQTMVDELKKIALAVEPDKTELLYLRPDNVHWANGEKLTAK